MVTVTDLKAIQSVKKMPKKGYSKENIDIDDSLKPSDDSDNCSLMLRLTDNVLTFLVKHGPPKYLSNFDFSLWEKGRKFNLIFIGIELGT